MRRAGVLTLLLAAAPAAAQQPAASTAPVSVVTVRRGTMKLLVHVQGTVRPEQLYRLKSTIDGRIQSIDLHANSWSDARHPIGTLLTNEMAALIDSNATTPTGVLEQRWQGEFQPTPIACPERCFVVKVYAQAGVPVRAGTLLAEAAGKLRLVGRVRPGDSAWVREGQVVEFWDKRDPSRRQKARIERFVRDVQGQRVLPGGTFTALLSPEAWIDAGAEWEGVIDADVRKDVLSVPTKALLVYDGKVYLPVRVSTGVTTYDETQIISPLPSGTEALQFEPGADTGIKHHVAPPAAVERYSLERRPQPAQAVPARSYEEPKSGEATIAPERWDRPKRKRQKAGPIDVFPDDQPGGHKDDRFPSDL
ncbi:MAG: hypothetical protein KGL53_15990 [Elusimicrobia bacterium]|nr:hypothetical protein [Elusimicrobiota bacterium]